VPALLPVLLMAAGSGCGATRQETSAQLAAAGEQAPMPAGADMRGVSAAGEPALVAAVGSSSAGSAGTAAAGGVGLAGTVSVSGSAGAAAAAGTTAAAVGGGAGASGSGAMSGASGTLALTPAGSGALDAGSSAASVACNLSGAAGAATPGIYVIGDSTASVYDKDLYPRMGWAQPLQDYFALACATVHDQALSGRSSKSFYDEGAWAPIRALLQRGDYVLIQFGHNDEKTDDSTLYTDPATTYPQYLTKYLDDAEAKGAIPVLLTSIARNKWSNGRLMDTHGAYPDAVRALAAKRNVPLVDTTALTGEYFQRLGQSETTKLFMDLAAGQFPNYPNGNSDDTHLQEQGARSVAQLTLAELAHQHSPIAALLQMVPVAP
jgi:lysophospholipase L1-like esterase